VKDLDFYLQLSPEPQVEISYTEAILNEQAPTSRARITRPSSRQDEYALYITEPATNLLGAMEYWRARGSEWPHLGSMAFDFLSIPAMSSE
jgi:hypothetical protein